MAIPEASISPYGPALPSLVDEPEQFLARLITDLDELHRAVHTLVQLAAAE